MVEEGKGSATVELERIPRKPFLYLRYDDIGPIRKRIPSCKYQKMRVLLSDLQPSPVDNTWLYSFTFTAISPKRFEDVLSCSLSNTKTIKYLNMATARLFI